MTRATVALLRGDFARAFAIHPLSPILSPLVLGLFAGQALMYVKRGDAFFPRYLPRAIEIGAAVLVVLLFAVWVSRFFGYFGGPVPLR
jgi:hypothetical protein